jgi:hypothetical protein
MQVKDVTTTSFGLLIAYLLPGLVGLYGGRYWLDEVDRLFMTLGTKEASFGLFLLVALAGLTIGMLVTPVKWVVYEVLLFRGRRIQPSALKTLGESGKHDAFRAVIDEQYRYHQCWGNMSLVLILLSLGWFHTEWSGLSFGGKLAAILLSVLIEGAVIWAAIESYRRYVDRATAVLS